MGSKCSKCKSNLTSSNISNCSLSNIEKNPELIQKDSIIQLAEEDSILNLEKIITKRPNNPDLLLKLASSLYEKGLSSQSCECYHNFIQQGYTLDTNSSILYAQILVQNKNYDSALEVLTKTLENNADDHKVHGFLGEIYYILEINDKSYYHTKEALRINDKVSEYHNNYGLCMMKEKKYSEALDHFLKAYELDHHMAKALNNAGNAHRKLGNIVEAKKCYTTAIDLIPRRKFPIALINLATAYFYTGDTLQALNHFEEALQTGSNIHKIMVKKGYHLLFKSPKTKSGIELLFKKDYTKSISILSEVLESDSNNPVVNYYIALALVKSSQINESTQYYRKTIEYGLKQIHANKQFVRYYMRKASKALNKAVGKKPCSEIPEVDEDSENSTINIGAIEVFKVRAGSLSNPYQPRKAASPADSPQNTSIEDQYQSCSLM